MKEVYPVLERGLRERRLCRREVARTLGISPRGLYNKLSGVTGFTWEEALALRRAYFPGAELTELFRKEAAR